MLAQDAGLCADTILEGSGASWADIESLRPFDLPEIARLFEYLADRTPQDFAIRSGYSSKVRNYGIVGFATMGMPTLRDALLHWSRYCLIAGDPLITRIVENGDEWQMIFETRLPMPLRARRYCIEAAVAAVEPVIEDLTNEPANSLRIDFAFPRPAATEAYTLFRAPDIRFSASSTTYTGKRGDLDRAIPAGDQAIQSLFHKQCDLYLSELTHSRSLAERLEDLLREAAGNLPSLGEMAAAFGMSKRSLQRELAGEGLTYQQLVRRFRQYHAFKLLEENSANLKTIAFTLGFEDVGSFRRAFHEWTGQSIGEWQASLSADRPVRNPNRYGRPLLDTGSYTQA
ncbi:AraC family transcriptional regulator [Sandaracinobacter sp. RS1-74]|uniref:AraC family transcriptional regulator n=1 Tax=Sandaracinobacteroides sayramensis TaxID=2913411 RepID=UPI001EDC4657|nr:AraC family transcriptional regulator [Sandaracinobacteroides sayramensis]MCG2842017.1 AraC family transcriptional regulator [Sandaracinobacteroides sayramensis]